MELDEDDSDLGDNDPILEMDGSQTSCHPSGRKPRVRHSSANRWGSTEARHLAACVVKLGASYVAWEAQNKKYPKRSIDAIKQYYRKYKDKEKFERYIREQKALSQGPAQMRAAGSSVAETSKRRSDPSEDERPPKRLELPGPPSSIQVGASKEPDGIGAADVPPRPFVDPCINHPSTGPNTSPTSAPLRFRLLCAQTHSDAAGPSQLSPASAASTSTSAAAGQAGPPSANAQNPSRPAHAAPASAPARSAGVAATRPSIWGAPPTFCDSCHTTKCPPFLPNQDLLRSGTPDDDGTKTFKAIASSLLCKGCSDLFDRCRSTKYANLPAADAIVKATEEVIARGKAERVMAG